MTSEIPHPANWIDQLPDPARHAIESTLTTRRFKRGALVFARSELPEGIHVVRSGSAMFCINAESGERLLLKIIRANELFGETIAFDMRPAPISVEARSDLVTSLIPAREIARLRADHPAIEIALARVTAFNLRNLLSRMEEGMLPLRERVAACLGRLVKEHDSNRIEITQSEFASMLGASRQVVNKVLADMKIAGRVKLEFRHLIFVPSPDEI